VYSFEDCELDPVRFELRRAGDPVSVEPQVFEVLACLVSNHERVVTKQELLDEVWPEGFVSEAALNSRIMSARRAIGDSGKEQRLIRTIHGRGFRFIAPVRQSDGHATASRTLLDQMADLRIPAPVVEYAKTSDGMSIAYSASGTGLPLVRTIGWFTHLELEWRWPRGYAYWSRFARRHRFVRFDGRGIGLSEPTDDFSLETRVRDLEAVVDALGLERFALVGISVGVYQAILYAARHPERVTHLISYGGGLDGNAREQGVWLREWDSLRRIMRQGWGIDTPAYRRLLTNLILGDDASDEDVDAFNELQRRTIDGRGASRFIGMSLADGVAEAALQVKAPTLVIHRQDDQLVPFSRSRRLAATVPGARLIALPGVAHWPLLDAVATDELVSSIEEFTAVPGGPAPGSSR
jgi:pimeloyl-ACP methyl ester carboxylesterase/DNA-binding winged helix-turn-helix (wHTH) protein